jgi:hypothetical protein
LVPVVGTVYPLKYLLKVTLNTINQTNQTWKPSLKLLIESKIIVKRQVETILAEKKETATLV